MDNDGDMYEEVYAILEMLGSEYKNKLPIKLYKHIAKNRNKSYVLNNTVTNGLRLRKDTIEFISYLNLMYWCDDVAERQRLVEIYTKNEEESL